MTTSQAGAYLRTLRGRQDLRQEELGAILGASRNTIQRMENGSDNTRHMTVMHAIATLNASANSYYELVVDSGVTLEQILRRHAVLDGLRAYARVIAQHRGLKGDAAHWAGLALTANLGLTNASLWDGAVNEFSLLMLLILLDVALIDLAEIVSATDGHIALGEHLATERIAFDAPRYTDIVIPIRHLERVPLLASVLRRLTQIKRQSEHQRLLQHEAELAISEIQHFLSHFLNLIGRRPSS
jgi:transcriptional regulator with XRE-family HTH domain